MGTTTAKRRIFFDMHFPDWPDRQTATAFDPEHIVNTFVKSHVDSVILYAKCQYGNFYYDTKVGHKHSGLGELDLFRETHSRLRRNNIETIAYYSVAWDEWYGARHPEHRTVDRHGQSNCDEFRWTTLCVNSPYREVVKEHLREICTELKPDGFWLDMTIIGRDRCFCPYCRAKFKAQYGMDLDPARWDDPDFFNRFKQFRYNYIEAYYDELYALIRALLPEAAVANNYWGYPFSSWTMGSRAVGALANADYITGEAYTDWSGLSAPGFFSKFLRGVAQNRPYEALIGRFCGTWDYTAKPAVQLALEAYTVAANGGTVTIDDMPYADGSIDDALYGDIAGIYGEIEKRQATLNGTPVRFAGIVHSQSSKDYAVKDMNRFTAAISGAYRLAKELQWPSELLFEETLSAELLDGLSVVFLPSNAVMSAHTLSLLQAFAEQGGLVISAGLTGQYTLEGDRLQPSTAFAELTGVAYQGPSDYSLSYIDLPVGAYGAQLTRPITIRSAYERYAVKDAAVHAYVMDPICETSAERFFHNNLPAPYETTSCPALLSKPVGQGAFVCFAQDVFAQFAGSHQLDVKTLFGNILRVHGQQPPIAFAGSSNIEFAYAHVDGRLVLQFVNFTPGMTICCGPMDTFTGTYPRTFEFVDSVSDIHNLRVTLRNVSAVSARALSDGSALGITQEGTDSVITVPKLSLWETIIVEE